MATDLETAAVRAVRKMLNAPQDGQMEAWWDAERTTRKAVTTAVLGGVSHRAIAVTVGCAGLIVVRLIDDDEARAAALVAERHHADRYAAEVRAATRQYAISTLGPTLDGVQKTVLADRLAVSRPTLDKWIAEELADGD